MSKINLGTASIDLKKLLVTRLLIQASSGGGKSWALRRLIEQAFGKIQIIVIDPEGEFATLREKFDFVLAGKGGDTPADARSAALLANRLLELEASSVCDLYEMNPGDRHRWVALFLDALVNAPKELWHPVLVIVDEAHVFCPERGKGDSEARSAVLGLISRGRKRGFCAILATQRLAKLDKDAAAELLNVMVGRTILDVDRDRAAEAVGIRKGKHEQENFHETVRALTPGEFFILGPAFPNAVAADRLKVGEVETTHPESGSAKAARKPATPENVKSLLPKLEDLPREAEAKQKTEAELRTEIRSLKGKLAQQPKPEADGATITRAVDSAIAQREREHRQQLSGFQTIIEKMQSALARIGKDAAQFVSIELPKVKSHPVSVPAIRAAATAPLNRPRQAPIAFDGELTGPERKILAALGQLVAIGKDAPPKNMVAAWSGYSPLGGAFGNPIGSLRSRGYVEYPQPGTVSLTTEGRAAVGECFPPTASELRQRIEGICTGPERKILTALLERGSDEITKDELAANSGYSPIGGAFGNPVGALRTKGLLDYPRPGVVKAADWLVESLV